MPNRKGSNIYKININAEDEYYKKMHTSKVKMKKKNKHKKLRSSVVSLKFNYNC